MTIPDSKLVGNHDTIPKDLAKRQSQASRPIDQCPSMVSTQPDYANYNTLTASYCEETSTREYGIICQRAQSWARRSKRMPTFVRGSGNCKSHEVCIDGPFQQNGLPRAWCISGEAFMAIGTIMQSSYNRVNGSNAAHMDDIVSPKQTNVSAAIQPNESRDFLYNVVPERMYDGWLTVFLIAGPPYGFIKANRMTIWPEDDHGRREGPSVSCRHCSKLTYLNDDWKAKHHYHVEGTLPPGTPAIRLARFNGL